MNKNEAIIHQNQVDEHLQNRFPPPPLWLKKGTLFFRIGLAVAILASSLLHLTGCTGSFASEISHQPARDYFKPEALVQILKENSSLEPSEEIFNPMQVYPLLKEPRVAFVDFNTHELCGQLGCLYTIYLESDGQLKRVFARYLNPSLPKGVDLIELADRTERDLPCIVINQVQGDDLHQSLFCFDGSDYSEVSNKLIGKNYD